MSREMIEIFVLAAIAGFVIFRLYSVFGKRTGSERPSAPPRPSPATVEAGPAPRSQPQPAPATAAPGVPGVADLQRLDPSFDPAAFLSGARAAYEMIVHAFATGDRDTLKRLLTPRVFKSYDAAIAERERSGGAAPELVRLRSAEIVEAGIAAEEARVAVRFEAELAEGASGLRDTRERWTFERKLNARDPNWFLTAVAQA